MNPSLRGLFPRACPEYLEGFYVGRLYAISFLIQRGKEAKGQRLKGSKF